MTKFTTNLKKKKVGEQITSRQCGWEKEVFI